MRRYTIKKGWHLSWPIVFPWIIFLPTFKGAKWRVVMTENTIYQNPKNYQGWNKGGGWIIRRVAGRNSPWRLDDHAAKNRKHEQTSRPERESARPVVPSLVRRLAGARRKPVSECANREAA